MKQNAPVARRYARALHALASEARRAEPVTDELVAFEQLLATEQELREALLRPWVKAATKRAIVLEVAERRGLSPLTRNFLALVAQRRRLDILGEIIAAYRTTVDEAAGRIRARVRSAAPLSGRRARGRCGSASGAGSARPSSWTRKSTRGSSAGSSPRSAAGSWT